MDLWWLQAGSVFSNCLTDGLDVSPLGGFCGSSWIFSHSGHHCKGGYLWVCRSLLSGWVSFHSEEWVLHSPELVIGRASITYEYAAPFGASECPLIPRNECSAPQSSLLVEPALLPSPRGPPMSMPLPSERRSSLSFWGMSSPLSRAHGWARRSPLSGGVSSHSEEWVLRSSELYDKSLSLLVELALLPSL